ncbi:MAG: hypothetical protein ACREUT_07395 [Steroidobacteraceae bacterium]
MTTDMRMWSAVRRVSIEWTILTLVMLPAWASTPAPPPAAALSPDQRPTLVIVAPPEALTIMHHGHPLPTPEAEQLALKVGLYAALPMIRRLARNGWDPLPRAWQTGEPDRGFSAEIAAALDPSQQGNWPWRALKIVTSSAEAEQALAQLDGQDAAVVTYRCQLEDQLHTVQLVARASVKLIHDAQTAGQSDTRFNIRHYARPLVADWGRSRESAAVFRSGGPLDAEVSAAALDLSHALAVVIARLTTPATLEAASRHFGDLTHKPQCSVCRPSDPVIHEEPGRVWVIPARLGATLLSLPVG